ncbi:MAG: decarboxylating NADP(+)-dependent phosphogluconate dehydrogenase [Acidimicrobiia bacterium]|nr:decarboxylating NADP(+)-dependent phosphogluconate dehydrogenase [Acidimicrobiia bacterium]
MKADFGLVGLAVMGQNLVLNMADHGYTVAVTNRTVERVHEFLEGPASGRSVIGTESIEELVDSLSSPRQVMLMVRAGQPVDDLIDTLITLLDPGDVIIDGGNSLFTDTIRRTALVEEAGMLFVGAGISGGEEGARNGPSIMPGGSPEAWPLIKEMFQAIAAEVDGRPCCEWIGPDGAGHYVKMVHNGIEYGDIQVIDEAYDLMRRGLDMSYDEMAELFAHWNDGVLESYLVEITADALRHRDDDGSPLLEKILDAAGQKGTGKWTVISSMELGMPTTLVAEAVYSRVVSSLVDERERAGSLLDGPDSQIDAKRQEALDDLRDALYASKIVSYAQGFMLMAAAAEEHGWSLDFGSIASLWRGGCIIRSRFLGDIMDAYQRDSDLQNLLFDPFFADATNSAQDGWRRTVVRSITAGIPAPAYSSALAFFDSYRSERLPANLTQALRDYFGAHTYERTDADRGQWFHTDWTGEGGDAASGSYSV